MRAGYESHDGRHSGCSLASGTLVLPGLDELIGRGAEDRRDIQAGMNVAVSRVGQIARGKRY